MTAVLGLDIGTASTIGILAPPPDRILATGAQLPGACVRQCWANTEGAASRASSSVT